MENHSLEQESQTRIGQRATFQRKKPVREKREKS
jgi:hypothetical protein